MKTNNFYKRSNYNDTQKSRTMSDTQTDIKNTTFFINYQQTPDDEEKGGMTNFWELQQNCKQSPTVNKTFRLEYINMQML